MTDRARSDGSYDVRDESQARPTLQRRSNEQRDEADAPRSYPHTAAWCTAASQMSSSSSSSSSASFASTPAGEAGWNSVLLYSSNADADFPRLADSSSRPAEQSVSLARLKRFATDDSPRPERVAPGVSTWYVKGAMTVLYARMYSDGWELCAMPLDGLRARAHEYRRRADPEREPYAWTVMPMCADRLCGALADHVALHCGLARDRAVALVGAYAGDLPLIDLHVNCERSVRWANRAPDGSEKGEAAGISQSKRLRREQHRQAVHLRLLLQRLLACVDASRSVAAECARECAGDNRYSARRRTDGFDLSLLDARASIAAVAELHVAELDRAMRVFVRSCDAASAQSFKLVAEDVFAMWRHADATLAVWTHAQSTGLNECEAAEACPRATHNERGALVTELASRAAEPAADLLPSLNDRQVRFESQQGQRSAYVARRAARLAAYAMQARGMAQSFQWVPRAQQMQFFTERAQQFEDLRGMVAAMGRIDSAAEMEARRSWLLERDQVDALTLGVASRMADAESLPSSSSSSSSSRPAALRVHVDSFFAPRGRPAAAPSSAAPAAAPAPAAPAASLGPSTYASLSASWAAPRV